MTDPQSTSGGNSSRNHDWNAFRRQMLVADRWAYFDHAAVAPLPKIGQEAISGWMEGAVYEGDTVWPQWVRKLEQGRGAAARLVQADPDEIAFVANTTTGITFVAEGFPWQSGDNVVTLANEFPSNQYPWLNLGSRGVETRRVPVDPTGIVDLQRLADAIDSRTRVVSVSWVGFATGFRLELDEIAALVHSRGAMLFLDAIQGLGVFPLDLRATPIDFLAADGHKWLLGPEGAGLLYIRRENLDRLRPINVGWNSVVQGNDYSRIELNLRPTTARYEGGSQNLVGGLALSASIQLLESFGAGPVRSAVGDRVLEVTDLACEKLQQAGATIVSCRRRPHASGIVAFDWPGHSPQELRQHLLAQRVVLSCRGVHLRISPHAYNNAEDVDRLVEGLRSFNP